jgi:hypothetical protein
VREDEQTKKAATLQRVAAFLELKGVSVKRAFGV